MLISHYRTCHLNQDWFNVALLYVVEDPASNLDPETSCLKFMFFPICLSVSRKFQGSYLRLGHDRFLSHFLESVLYCLLLHVYSELLTASLNKGRVFFFVHAMQAHKGLNGGEWSASRSGCLTPEKELRFTLNGWLGGPQSRSGHFSENRNRFSYGDSSTGSSSAWYSRCIEYATSSSAASNK